MRKRQAEQLQLPAGPATIAGAEDCFSIHYFQMDDEEASYPRLRQRLAELDEVYNTRGTAYTCSGAPIFWADCGFTLSTQDDLPAGTWQRVVVEKPFGQDLASPGS